MKLKSRVWIYLAIIVVVLFIGCEKANDATQSNEQHNGDQSTDTTVPDDDDDDDDDNDNNDNNDDNDNNNDDDNNDDDNNDDDNNDNEVVIECVDADNDWWCVPYDCNDADANINPGVIDIPENGEDENCDGQDAEEDPQIAGCAAMDILFVIDTSMSMADEQDNLAENFPRFIEKLDAYMADSPSFNDYRIGVTNMTYNDTWDTPSIPNCKEGFGLGGSLFTGDYSHELLIDDCNIGDNPWLDYGSPTMTADFECMTEKPSIKENNPAYSCGVETPFEVIEQFGEKLTTDNAGFYRKDENSMLVVILITDEDESTNYVDGTPEEAKAALDAMSQGAVIDPEEEGKRYVLVVVAGNQECGDDTIEAVELKKLVELTPNGFFGDICEQDLVKSLEDALEMMEVACDNLDPIITK